MLTAQPPTITPTRRASSRPQEVEPRSVSTAPLRVVDDRELAEARRQARARQLAGLAVVGVALGLFGVVVAHVMLMQGQFELQRLQDRSTESRAQYDRLRLQVSELESPNRIVAVAQQKLGMVSPPNITYLAPTSEPAAQPATVATVEQPSNSAAAASPDNWSSVKSSLSEG